MGVERVFNVAKDVIGDRRHHLAAQKIRQILILKHSISQEVDDHISSTNTDLEDDEVPCDEVSDLFELPANVEDSERENEEVSGAVEEVDMIEDELRLPPRKRVRPARYRDT